MKYFLIALFFAGCNNTPKPNPADGMYVNSFKLSPGEYDRSPLGVAMFMAKDSSIKVLFVRYDNGSAYRLHYDSTTKSININKIK